MNASANDVRRCVPVDVFTDEISGAIPSRSSSIPRREAPGPVDDRRLRMRKAGFS
jgi:hypothetical protein